MTQRARVNYHIHDSMIRGHVYSLLNISWDISIFVAVLIFVFFIYFGFFFFFAMLMPHSVNMRLFCMHKICYTCVSVVLLKSLMRFHT